MKHYVNDLFEAAKILLVLALCMIGIVMAVPGTIIAAIMDICAVLCEKIYPDMFEDEKTEDETEPVEA